MTGHDQHADVQAWVEQLRREGFARTPVERLCDQPVAVKAAAMLADPKGYFIRVRDERAREAQEAVGREMSRLEASATSIAEPFRWTP